MSLCFSRLILKLIIWPVFVILFDISVLNATFLAYNYSLPATSRRSRECEFGNENCVCLGTENGRNTIKVERNLSHYERLKKSFINCQTIVGNLEITHIDENDLLNDFIETKAENGTTIRVTSKPFQFLEHIEEITGYLLFFNIQVKFIAMPRLRIIWGEKTHENNTLQIDNCPILEVLSFPSLRTLKIWNLAIDEGYVKIRNSNNLCYMSPSGFIDYSQFLGNKFNERLKIQSDFSQCHHTTGCSEQCVDNKCYGSMSDQCQIVYRGRCENCATDMCYKSDQGWRCCDEGCTGGCFGDGKEKCYACKNFEEDGKCVDSCRGIYAYKKHSLIKEELPDNEKRYFYGRHCVRECPSGTLIEDKFCVTRCSSNYHRDMEVNDAICVPCNGACPKVCQVTERIDKISIKNLVNCSEIDGNLEILNHVFEWHMPDTSRNLKKLPSNSGELIPPLTASDLEVLKSVRIITGHLVIDGGMRHNLNKPDTLSFLENLEMIEGRYLYFEKYSLYVIGNVGLKWLGLKSLKKIKNGLISFAKNPSLCYSYTIPFQKVLGIKDSSWPNNMPKEKCESLGRKCHSSCDSNYGCWGPGADMCVRCRNFIRDGICTDDCPEIGFHFHIFVEFYLLEFENPRRCMRCHSQCLTCFGPQSTDCKQCKHFEFWTKKIDKHTEEVENTNAPLISSKSFTFLLEKVKTCVAKCPNSTYVTDENNCEPCNSACYRYGCTGPSNEQGVLGCNRCRYGIEDEKTKKVKCLMGENENSVCTKNNNIPSNFYIALSTTNTSKYMCRKCREECLSCSRESVSTDECECASYTLIDNIENKPSLASTCVNECSRGSFIVSDQIKDNNNSSNKICMKCHKFCDERFSCTGPKSTECVQCASAGVIHNKTIVECLAECPLESPFSYEGLCHEDDKEVLVRRKRNTIIAAAFAATALFGVVIAYLIYRCTKYRKKYEKEAQMHLPEIPMLDPKKVTQRPNMRRLNLIAVDELDDSKNNILGSGAFGIVYAGKWKPPTRSGISIPVAIKAINPSESRHTTDAEMMKEAGLMASIQHEHLLPLVGICVAKGGIKIVTILRPLGSLLKFLEQHKNRLGSKNLMLYCYQISSAMEFLAKKKIVHRDLAARNVLVKNINHVEVTDFGLAQMLQGSDTAVVVEGRVAVKWLAIESLRQQIYTERTDVWSFGVTCWEILTFGESPYKELELPRDQRLARELVTQLEKGYRLRQPANCSQELYQELLNCWLVDPDSRPSFRQLKEKFELFCRAPHIYIQERQAAQRMDSITLSDQRQMIEKLLQDNDFLDPVNIDPAEYTSNSQSVQQNRTNNFFSTNTMETTLPPASPCTPTRPLMYGEQIRTNTSSRYKSDTVSRKYRFSSSEDSFITQNSHNSGDIEVLDEENYLMPRNGQNTINSGKHSLLGKSINEEPTDTDFENEEDNQDCTVHGIDVFTVNLDNDSGGEEYLPTYLNEVGTNSIDGEHDKKSVKNLLIDSKDNATVNTKCGQKIVPYVNVQQHETSI